MRVIKRNDEPTPLKFILQSVIIDFIVGKKCLVGAINKDGDAEIIIFWL